MKRENTSTFTKFNGQDEAEYPAQASSAQTSKYSQRTHAPAQSQSMLPKHTDDLV